MGLDFRRESLYSIAFALEFTWLRGTAVTLLTRWWLEDPRSFKDAKGLAQVRGPQRRTFLAGDSAFSFGLGGLFILCDFGSWSKGRPREPDVAHDPAPQMRGHPAVGPARAA